MTITHYWNEADRVTVCGEPLGSPSLTNLERFVTCVLCLAVLNGEAVKRREPGQQTWRIPRGSGWDEPPVYEEHGMKLQKLPVNLAGTYRAEPMVAGALEAGAVVKAEKALQAASWARTQAVAALAYAKARVLETNHREMTALAALRAAREAQECPASPLSATEGAEHAPDIREDVDGSESESEASPGLMREWVRRMRIAKH